MYLAPRPLLLLSVLSTLRSARAALLTSMSQCYNTGWIINQLAHSSLSKSDENLIAFKRCLDQVQHSSTAELEQLQENNRGLQLQLAVTVST